MVEARRGGPLVRCVVCGKEKAPWGRNAPAVLYLCWGDPDCAGYRQDPQPDTLWPGEPSNGGPDNEDDDD